MNKQADFEAKKELAKQEVIKKAQKYKRVFSSPEGQEVLADLHANFVFDYLCGESGGLQHESIVIRSAQRDVVEFINRNIRVAERNFE